MINLYSSSFSRMQKYSFGKGVANHFFDDFYNPNLF